MSNIILKAEHRRAIAQRGEALYPSECRGVLLGQQNGTNTRVEALVFLDDAEAEAGHRYSLAPQERAAAEQQASAQGLQIVGAFHSHVDQPARPSIHDRHQADPNLSYVIVGIRQGRAHELAAWKLSPDGSAFVQEDIRSA